jgi:hypothetical protein
VKAALRTAGCGVVAEVSSREDIENNTVLTLVICCQAESRPEQTIKRQLYAAAGKPLQTD